MKKTTSQKFSKRLAKYGALSVAIASFTDVNGQIVYTDIADVGGAGVFYALDVNNDTIPDFLIGQINYATSYNGIPGGDFYNILACGPYYSTNNYSNAILGNNGPYLFVYPFALSFGATISSNQTSWNTAAFQTMNYNSCIYGGDFWCPNIGEAYLGLRFKLLNGTDPDTIHYGWARIEIGAIASDWLIKDYAYNSTPNAPINAGQKTLGIDDNNLSKIKIVGLNKSIGIYNLFEATDYTLFSMTGQEVLKGTTNTKDYVIEAHSLSSGVYVLELTDTNSKSFIRKKIVLQ